MLDNLCNYYKQRRVHTVSYVVIDSRVETDNFDTFSHELLFIVHCSVIVVNAVSGLSFSMSLV